MTATHRTGVGSVIKVRRHDESLTDFDNGYRYGSDTGFERGLSRGFAIGFLAAVGCYLAVNFGAWLFS